MEKEKPSLFDREICVKLEDSKRCQDCCFWEKIRKISVITGQQCKDEHHVEVKDEDLGKLFGVSIEGCSVLTEICPNCIVDLSEFKEHRLGLVICNGEKIVCKPAFLCMRDKGIFYCPLCKKEYKHSEVKHLIDSVKIANLKRKKDGQYNQREITTNF